MTHSNVKAMPPRLKATPPARRVLTALANGVTKACNAAPLPLGIAVIGLTVLSFIASFTGHESLMVPLGIGMISGIALLVLTDYLPSLFKAIAGINTTPGRTPPADSHTTASEASGSHPQHAA